MVIMAISGSCFSVTVANRIVDQVAQRAVQRLWADGHISRRGDRHVTSLLYEAAMVILTRRQADSDLRTWGLKLKERIGFKRAAVAVARKLAVIMHVMLRADTSLVRIAKTAA